MEEIKDYKGSYITKDGKVFSKKSNKFLSINVTNGYNTVTINGNKKNYK